MAGGNRQRVAFHHVWIFVRLHTDAVAGAVNEVLAEASVGDHAPRRSIHLLATGADNAGCDACGLRCVQHCVCLGHLRLRFAQRYTAGYVAAIASHGAAKVAQHKVAINNHPVASVMVW